MKACSNPSNTRHVILYLRICMIRVGILFFKKIYNKLWSAKFAASADFHHFRLRLFGTTTLRICELLASSVFQKIEISRLCNALTTGRPFEPNCLGQEAKLSNDLHNSEWRTLTIIYTTANRLEIGWVVIEKSRPERDPKLTRLCDLLPTRSKL